MSLEDVLALLEIEEAAEFHYFEDLVPLMEASEELAPEDLYQLLAQADMAALGELLETYLEELLEGLPSETAAEVYTFLSSVKLLLLGLAEALAGREEKDPGDLAVFSEELHRLREWLTREEAVILISRRDGQSRQASLLEAMAAYRAEKLQEGEYEYDFDGCQPYEINEYRISLASMMAGLAEEEDEDEGSGDEKSGEGCIDG